MTIGKSSKKQKAPRAPPFLDRASGFYGRLDEIEIEFRTEAQITEKQEMKNGELPDDQEHCVLDFSEGMMEDDGTTLLKRKPSRLSRRWSRKSSRRTKSDKSSLEIDSQRAETEVAPSINPSVDVHLETQPETGSGSRAPEPMLIHFSIREEADDQKLISEGKERQREMKGKRRQGEVEGKADVENMKVVKRNSLRNYHKVLDKAFRRGWETFIANLYSVTLSPAPSSVSSPSKSEMDRKAALADFR
ncbi:hypothetical protein PHYPO_G00193880 [Pangasianodon hypophthalmus]|uniref:Uncharacterized protein n=1 Tax=Pangasianodon hypophthalmus TaxID=310915 RepID=A0A5N5PIA3_PANHP|nr:uncharacterized protein sb:cb1058 [Pangasianodon hypophthalmus]XP_026792788.2 uncharacterized protein sb:cb1058 [Pangasianodon hypophthalmus]KAB5579335.1 hypothetical protein PHYPO_G00193880 [Pangasianodon hypophthalmus]